MELLCDISRKKNDGGGAQGRSGGSGETIPARSLQQLRKLEALGWGETPEQARERATVMLPFRSSSRFPDAVKQPDVSSGSAPPPVWNRPDSPADGESGAAATMLFGARCAA